MDSDLTLAQWKTTFVTAENERYCVRCKWMEQQSLPGQPNPVAMCNNPKQGKNLVTGQQRIQTCGWHRAMLNYSMACCGAGLWWEQKEGGIDTTQTL